MIRALRGRWTSDNHVGLLGISVYWHFVDIVWVVLFTVNAVAATPPKVTEATPENPVPVMTLVEIIRGIATSDATYALTEELSRRLGKTPVEVNDFPGFVSNRILMPMINEAIFTLGEGVASAEASAPADGPQCKIRRQRRGRPERFAGARLDPWVRPAGCPTGRGRWERVLRSL